jgi:hypothetical protein
MNIVYPFYDPMQWGGPEWKPGYYYTPTTTAPTVEWHRGQLPANLSPSRGWQCPGCLKCYGPHVDECKGCGK